MKGEEKIQLEPQEEDPEDDTSVSSEEEDDLVLEGVLQKVGDVDSSSEESSDDEDEDEDEETAKEVKGGNKGKRKKETVSLSQKKKKARRGKKKKKKDDDNGMEIVNVDFTFCDMDEKYFWGIKTLLTNSSSPLYAAHSSELSDLMIENVSVGTVISIENDPDDNVYGFASVVNVKHNKKSFEEMKNLCLKHCPEDHAQEMDFMLSGKTKRPAGFLLHARMMNLPLEIVEVLHQQLVMDMDWAVDNAQGGEDERKSLDFGAFLILAPCTKSDDATVVYKYFDDEIFASSAEFTFTFDAPKGTAGGGGKLDPSSSSLLSEEKQFITAIVLTKTGHRAAMKELTKFVKR